MRKSGLTMVSARHYSVPNNQNGADRGIWARLPDGLSGLRKRTAHEPFIDLHVRDQLFDGAEAEQIFSDNEGLVQSQSKIDVEICLSCLAQTVKECATMSRRGMFPQVFF
jgi:hypothetical protein